MTSLKQQQLRRVTLLKGRDASLRRLHPWVFSGALDSGFEDLSEGDAVEVYSSSGEYRGTGFFSKGSIAVKIFSFRKAEPDEAFWSARIAEAIDQRRALELGVESATDAYRVINAEGDRIPGLIVDRYAGALVMQCHHFGVFKRRECFAKILHGHFGEEIDTVYCKSADTLQLSESEAAEPRVAFDHHLIGDKKECVIRENGLKYQVDWVAGQKTGFFLDQRENRAALGVIAGAKRVLNCFSYTGGFTVSAVNGGATQVTSVDSSGPALQLLEKNLALNSSSPAHRTVESDCFDFLKQDTETYDVIVVDPPPFAKSRAAVERALTGYRAINHLALKRLAPGGFLMSFSCSQVVSRTALREAIQQAAADLGRSLAVVRELSHPPCHPVSIHHPEGEYLKGFLMRVGT